MTRQGSCLAPTQDAGNILDRLEGLSKVIPPELMEQALLETGRGKQKACRLSHGVMLWIVLAMGVLTHLPIRQVFKHARRMRSGPEKTPLTQQSLRGPTAAGRGAGAAAFRSGGSAPGHATDTGSLLQGAASHGN